MHRIIANRDADEQHLNKEQPATLTAKSYCNSYRGCTQKLITYNTFVFEIQISCTALQ